MKIVKKVASNPKHSGGHGLQLPLIVRLPDLRKLPSRRSNSRWAHLGTPGDRSDEDREEGGVEPKALGWAPVAAATDRSPAGFA
jgi:hypothetical protein